MISYRGLYPFFWWEDHHCEEGRFLAEEGDHSRASGFPELHREFYDCKRSAPLTNSASSRPTAAGRKSLV